MLKVKTDIQTKKIKKALKMWNGWYDTEAARMRNEYNAPNLGSFDYRTGYKSGVGMARAMLILSLVLQEINPSSENET